MSLKKKSILIGTLLLSLVLFTCSSAFAATYYIPDAENQGQFISFTDAELNNPNLEAVFLGLLATDPQWRSHLIIEMTENDEGINATFSLQARNTAVIQSLTGTGTFLERLVANYTAANNPSAKPDQAAVTPSTTAAPIIASAYIQGQTVATRVDAVKAGKTLTFDVNDTASYSAGGLTLSDDGVTVTGTVNGIAVNQTVNRNSDFVAIIKQALNIQLTEVPGSTLLLLNNTQLTLTKNNSSSTYTIMVN